MYREIGEQPAFCIREGTCDAMKTWQRDHRIAQTAEPVNQDLPNRQVRLQSSSPEWSVSLFRAETK